MTTEVASVAKGLAFARYARSLMVAKGDPLQAIRYAEGLGQRWRLETPEVMIALKSLISPITTDDEALAPVRTMGLRFIEMVRPRSLIDRLVGMREVPPLVAVAKVTGGASCWWVGQGRAKPVGRFSLERVALNPNKLVAMLAFTDELAKNSTPKGERTFTIELARGVASFSDVAFIDPSLGPTNGVSPGSITYGAPSAEASGTTTAAAQADIQALFRRFVTGGGMLEDAVLVMHPRTAAALGQMTVTSGGLAFPNVGARGGEVSGVPVFTTSACELSGSPGETFMTLFDPFGILMTEDDGIQASVSVHAAVQLDDSPASTAQPLVSLWQHNLIGLRVERYISWQRSDDASVVVLRGINY
jgi:HK97 family phage major capsid protein